MNDRDKSLSETLFQPQIHEKWVRLYEAGENDRFYQNVVDEILKRVPISQDVIFLDAGCGDASKSVRLAKRGVSVQAIDFSSSALQLAKNSIKDSGLSKNICVAREDLCALSFEDESFDHILCWGVLMHIPNEEAAIRELVRVLKRGGYLIIGEVNMKAIEVRVQFLLKRLIHKKSDNMELTDRGIEYWKCTKNETLFARKSNIDWIIKFCRSNELIFDCRLSAELTEIYTKVPWKVLRQLIHAANLYWFRAGGSPNLAVGNILFFRRQ